MVIGVTGGIGSGKSYICNLFEIASFPVFYSDIVAKRIIDEDNDVKESIKAVFGDEAYIEVRSLDEKKNENSPRKFILDRKYIAEKIFNDSKLREKMNSIVHPLVFREFEEWKEKQVSNIVVVESAILFESGMNRLVDKVIVVSAPMEIRIARLLKREATSVDEIRKRIECQCSDAEKLRQADYIITNGPHDDVNRQIFGILSNIQEQIFDITDGSCTHSQTSLLK